MSEIAIRVENLSKQYHIGGKQEGYRTLRDTLTDAFVGPVRKVGGLLRGRATAAANLNETIWALKDVSFEVKRGEVVGIIGRNGAGKSTLLKILSRITEPTKGRAEIHGRVGSLLEVGTGFHPELTGRENIYLNGAVLGMKRAEIEQKFDEIVAFAEVEKFIDTPVKHYSSGMYLRLAFAVAAHLDPEILLVDEVLAVGDAAFQKKCLGKMDHVAREGRTVLFVSHNLPAIISLCSRSFYVKSGKIVLSGNTEEALAMYLSEGQKHGNGSLCEHIDRHGSGALQFTRWSIVDEIFGEGQRVGCNHACTLILHYRAKELENYVENVAMSVVLRDQLGQRLLTCSTQFVNADFACLPPVGNVKCHIEMLPLMPGIYTLHLWCAVRGEAADLIEEAGSFEVVPVDVFGTGRFPDKKFGQFIVKHSWQGPNVVTKKSDKFQDRMEN